MSKIKVHYRVQTNSTFSDLDTFTPNGKGTYYTKPIETIEEANEAIRQYGECPNGSESSKQFWAEQAANCTVVKVTTIIEPA